jgi:hypothetical protein
MATCPACEAELPDDDYADMELGEQVDCPECSELIEISNQSPLEFEIASEEDEEEKVAEEEELQDLDDEDEAEDKEEDWDQ